MLKPRRSTAWVLLFVCSCLFLSLALLLPSSQAQKKAGNQQKIEPPQHPGTPVAATAAASAEAADSNRTSKDKAPRADLSIISEVIRQPLALGVAAEPTAEELEKVNSSGTLKGGGNLKEVPGTVRNAKSAGVTFTSYELFQPATLTMADAQATATRARVDEVLSDKVVLNLNTTTVDQLRRDKDEYLTLSLPDGKGGGVELELVKVNIFAPGFKVQTAEPTDEALEESLGVHYRGIVKGDDRSLAAVSVFANEVMGFYSTEAGGNTVLGRLGGDNPTNTHVLYAEADLNISPNFECNTKDDAEALPASALQSASASMARCIRIYLEVDYDVYLNKGSVSNATNYVTGVFNQSAALFSNDGIPISLSEVFVWNAQSPYGGLTKSGELLSRFQEYRNAFNGDLGHLVALRGGGGVAAGFNGFCNTNIDARQCFSGINSTFSNVPTYSWTVNVFTHEMGHLMGSRHTHACVWNGNGTAIDGCGPAAFVDPPVTYEGSCSGAPIPSGGTIMSYCHLSPNPGINFSFGFGPQPRNVIVNRFNSASCLVDCGGDTCTYSLGATGQQFAASGGSGSFTVTTSSTNCAWTAASGVSWVTTSGSGSGSGTVSFSVAANTGNARSGSITVGGQTFSVTQSAGGGGGCPSTPISPGQTLGGTLTTSDCIFSGTTRYVDVYNFSGGAGQQVAVSMSSASFDTYLYLLTSGGQLLTQDDDGGTGTNSRIPAVSGSFTLPAAGSYTLYATSYSSTGLTGSTGSYSISISLSGGGVRGKTVGVFRPTNGIIYLKNSNTSGFADLNLVYGIAGDQPVAGDWNGNGVDSMGIYRNGVFYLRNSNTTGAADIVFPFGAAGDLPIAGDWNGDGIDTIGVYRSSQGVFYLRNSNTAGPADMVFVLGNPGDVPIAGDWNGDGITTTGVFRPSNGIIYLKNSNTSGNADIYLVYGIAGDLPVAGDWNGDGLDSVGIYRDGLFYLRNSNTQGFADMVFALGNFGDVPVAGDWDGLP